MTKRRTKWLQAMQEKYQTDEAGVSEIMRQRQKLAYQKRKANGPWKAGYNDTELAKTAGQKGLKSRWGYTQSKED